MPEYQMSVTTAMMVVALNNHLTAEWTLSTLVENGVVDAKKMVSSDDVLALKDFLEPLTAAGHEVLDAIEDDRRR